MKSFFTMFLLMFGVVGLYRASGHAHCPLARRAHGHPPAAAALAAPGEAGRWEQDNAFEEDEDDDRDRREVRWFRYRTVADERAPAEGLPVPIYPGTRVTEAEIRPPQPPRPPRPPAPPVKLSRQRAAVGIQAVEVEGRISATEPRAEADARVQLLRQVREWLAPEVPASWRPPARMIDRLVVAKHVRPVVKPYGTLYVATFEADLSPPQRQQIVGVYQRQLVARRLTVLGGALGFVLACLAAVAGYIRTDEATKGYYTGWLRAAAAAGVGAAGVLIYQVLT